MIREHKQFNLPGGMDISNPNVNNQEAGTPLDFGNKDFNSTPNVLQTAKSIQIDQSIGIGQSPDNNAKMAAKGQYYSVSNPNSTVSATATIDWSKGNTQRIGITQTTTLAFSNIKAGGRYILEVQQDETGSRAITWPSSVVWAGGSAATASGALKVDLYAFYNNGSSTFASSSLNY
jgi:hypothetical protein